MGYYNDMAGAFDSKENDGFKERMERFVDSWTEATDDVPAKANYTDKSVVFGGKLYHDFLNVDSQSKAVYLCLNLITAII